MESNLATVDLSDFSHSLLMCSIKSLEMISFLESLYASLGHIVHMFAAGIWVMSSPVFCLGGLPHFLFTCVIIIFCLMNIQIIYPMQI